MTTILLQAGGGSLFTNGFFMIAMLAVLIFFMIIPQRKKAREQKEFMEGLEKGQQVVTASGILGSIDKIEDRIVTLNVGNKTYIRVTKNAISKELTDAIFTTKADKE
ncbi:preprotein translocase subunit YajC [Neolewinella lacunae]|uniref:Sec translocon accessory complex subunit YajC n=1 Tax=Neolewinella lacunae TaxID=1517758 RepID=A0A923PJJ0_9BACT|nr:preprotein translocase subunit YajC [Neolewinella lacunae]MBC6995237.1 preprotein translocase subunit YajC [Neolewinella lacunae]MDN3635454.1 preprotein translocase subunit YajC [Neolewinella lacunae]